MMTDEKKSIDLEELKGFIRRLDPSTKVVAEGDGVVFAVADIRLERKKDSQKLVLELL